MKPVFLDFEQPIAELTNKIEELRFVQGESAVDISDEIARLSALQAVAKSDGKAKVVILTDSLYEIALRKANVMKEVIEQCKECQVLEFIDTPLADTSSRMPSLTFSLLQKYGDDLQYTLAINDLYFDFMAPSLRSANKGDTPYNISAGDGSVTAYQRMLEGDFSTAWQ